MDIPRITRPGVVMPLRTDPTGARGPTPGQARGPRWRPVGGGFHVPSDVDLSLDQRIVEAVCAHRGGPLAATGWAALAWLAPRWFEGYDANGSALPVPVALDDRRAIRPRPGIRLTEDFLFGADVITVDGLPITRPIRSVSFEARTAATLTAAVRAIDMACYHDLVSLAELATHTARLSYRPGVVRLREAIALADENAMSPQETTMRLLWLSAVDDCTLLCNAAIFDLSGRHLFTPDLLDARAGVAGEYDGRIHLLDERRSIDLNRQETARRMGIEVATMMSGPRAREEFVQRLRGSYARAAARTGDREWTLERPRSWRDTTTVAARRALSAYDRERWLRHRSP